MLWFVVSILVLHQAVAMKSAENSIAAMSHEIIPASVNKVSHIVNNSHFWDIDGNVLHY